MEYRDTKLRMSIDERIVDLLVRCLYRQSQFAVKINGLLMKSDGNACSIASGEEDEKDFWRVSVRRLNDFCRMETNGKMAVDMNLEILANIDLLNKAVG